LAVDESAINRAGGCKDPKPRAFVQRVGAFAKKALVVDCRARA
jgi:hypothetical protein